MGKFFSVPQWLKSALLCSFLSNKMPIDRLLTNGVKGAINVSLKTPKLQRMFGSDLAR